MNVPPGRLQNDDVIGVATSWEEPSNRALSDQYVVEAFYRFYITPHTHLTPDIQVVIDPAKAPSKHAVVVFGLRLRNFKERQGGCATGCLACASG